MEIWKDIKGYEGHYQISNTGRVKSLERKDSMNRVVKERILVPCNSQKENKGYLQVNLSKESKSRCHRIHQMVANAFIPNNNLLEINHKDGDRNNNKDSNLEWCTHAHNMKHASENNLMRKGESHFKDNPLHGTDNHQAKLTESQVMRIRFIDRNIKVPFGYWKKVAKAMGIHYVNLLNAKNGKSWRHVEI